MDINIIESAIQDLENADTTADNVLELSALYIVRERLKTPLYGEVDGLEKELQDIFPAYLDYKQSKSLYQRQQTDETPVINTLSQLCREIEEFIQLLYSNTNHNKERRVIRSLLESLSNLNY